MNKTFISSLEREVNRIRQARSFRFIRSHLKNTLSLLEMRMLIILRYF
ncbi:hypothetical protein LEP1GSC016_1867 [Leptospira borgpetersenii serovar Hardjo-bovis str. Sponselee]|uniref:Uncharacterized protein n=1 Tax=Leptospira borgpetersenii serovar Hardjo-bovis str. Sponselee TaxID=1303729 RepID=M6BXI6_LEPBO|nr:hypothetical protein LEP1GSC016_1867 [Leptospira borgpetersenii serovar Hardjo-bovis str. Sponselee]